MATELHSPPSKAEQIHLLPNSVSLTEFLQWDIKNLSFIRS